MATENARIVAQGKVEPMGNQFNVLVYGVEQYLDEFERAGCGTRADWNGTRPLRITINRKAWVSQLRPGDEVEYVLEPVRRKDKKSPTGFKVGTRGIALTIISRAAQ
jgi:hypothetical protein